MKKENLIKTKYLIIGNSAGSIGASEAIREIDTSGKLTIVTDEPYPAYSRPLISEYLSGERSLETMLFRPEDFYIVNNIDLLKGEKVTMVDFDRKLAHLESGENIAWQKLLLSTGGKPIVPKIEGMDKKGVFHFIRLDDAKQIYSYLIGVNRAVVIGGGLIGISVTEALSKRGIIVTVVEMKDRVLNTILDESASAIASTVLTQKGIRLIINHTVSEIMGEKRVEGVVLDDGLRLSCELVIIAIGVLPQTDLVKNTAIKVNHGIVVDRYMTTSHPDVYACGDTAESFDFATDTNRLTPIWPNAYIGGKTAGYNMVGRNTEYRGGTAMNSINYFGMDIFSAGIVSTLDNNKYESITRKDNGIYQKIMLHNNQVKGLIFIGDIEKSGIIFGLMRDAVNVGQFKNLLLAPDFGLVDLPRELRREMIGALTGAQHILPAREEEEQSIIGD
jgi:NAD(P)H-nitrite reductase large subunit